MVPSEGDLMDIRNEWAHGRNIMVIGGKLKLNIRRVMFLRKDHMVDTNDSIYTKVTPLVITKCMSLIHLHVRTSVNDWRAKQ